MNIWNLRMKQLRENTDVTLEQMAEIIGVSEATVQRYESGVVNNVPYNAIIAYAAKFNASPCFIMGWDAENKSPEHISSTKTQNVLTKISKLNYDGQKEAEKYIDYLLTQKQYIKTSSEMVSGE